MTLATVVSALTQSIVPAGPITPTSTIDLYAAATTQPPLSPMVAVLAKFTIASTFSLTNLTLTQTTETAAVLTGSGRWGLAGALAANVVNVAVRLDMAAATASSETVVFSLALNVTTPNWTFAVTFPVLPPSWQAINGAVKQIASFLNSVQVNRVQLAGSSLTAETGITLSGSVPLTDFWTGLANWSWISTVVGPWPLALSGKVTLPIALTDPPTMDLTATNPVNSLLLGTGLPSITNMGFRLLSSPAVTTTPVQLIAFSSLNLIGTVTVGTLSAVLECPVMEQDSVLPLTFTFPIDGGRVTGMDQIGSLFGLSSLPVPANFLPLPAFAFKSVEFWIRPSIIDFAIEDIVVTIVSTEPWKSPIPFITVEDCGISWLLTVNGADVSDGYLAATIFGTLVFGTVKPVHIDVAVTVPDWVASADMRDGDYISITDLFSSYFSSSAPTSTPGNMNVIALEIEASPLNQSYFAGADIIFGTPDPVTGVPPVNNGWTIDLGVTQITLRGLSAQISVVNGAVSGGIACTFSLGSPDDAGTPNFMLEASYPMQSGATPVGWIFAGQLIPNSTIDLIALVNRFIAVPSWAPSLTIDRLYFTFSTGAETYAFGGTVSSAWTPTLFGTTLKISASVSLDVTKVVSSATAGGKLSGLFSINQILLTATANLNVAEPTYEFQVQFGDIWIRAVTSWLQRSQTDPRHQVVTLQLGGTTVGGILEYLVNLAAPTVGYSLDAPWSILNSIELSRFALTLDPTDNIIEFVYSANANLGFMRLDTIGVRYTRGANSGVSLILTGDLLGKTYSGDDLSWDVVNGNPPALPGGGEAFIDLRYIGLGQRVRLTTLPNTVAETLALIEGEMKPVTKTDQNPLTGQGVQWSPSSQFLIGLDVTLLDMIDLGIVLNDPVLYGLSIALSGDGAGSLAGLKFEILYKKITDSVGMFRIELTVPEAFRTFEFGEVSVTLGVIVIEIYTNGNFKIDLGFPYNRSFERSFTVEVFPFLGRGGIYFGILDGSTSTRVPRITNGSFSPVIELGVGLAIGVGKDINAGPLSGGIYVQVEVIVEGVIAWYHPTTAGGSTSMYYWAQGVAAIHGKLYGSVDFYVIKVSVTLEAYASAMITLEAHKPTLFALEVRVSAEAEIKILFIRISFSFSVELNVSFEVGSASATPWILASDQSGETVPSLSLQRGLSIGLPTGRKNARSLSALGRARQIMPAPRRRPNRRLAALVEAHRQALSARRVTEFGTGAGEVDVANTFDWQPTKLVFSDSPRPAPMVLIPSFTIGNVPLSWTGTPPVNPNPTYRIALQLFASTGVSPEALTAAAVAKRSPLLSAFALATSNDDDDTDTNAAETLIRGLLLYCLYAIPGGPQALTDTVTAGQVALANDWLNDPTKTSTGFNPTQLSQFFNTNIHPAISGIPTGTTPPTEFGAMAVALPPVLSWTSTSPVAGGNPVTVTVDLATDNQIGPLYLWGLATQAASFSPNATATTAPPDDPASAYESYAGHVFSDWCLVIARAAMRDLATQLAVRTLPVATDTDTLTSIAATIDRATVPYPVRPNDTVETVADTLGATVDELTSLNSGLATTLATAPVGSIVSVLLGVSPEVLALDNPGCVLKVPTLDLGDITLPITMGDTISSLAIRFGVTMTAIMSVPGQSGDAKLLASGATFTAPTTNWTTAPAGVTLVQAAATFYTRYAIASLVLNEAIASPAAWYSQSVANFNTTALQTVGIVDAATGEIAPNTSLQIPSAYNSTTASPTPYVTVPGDTLVRIGYTLNLAQNSGIISDPGWATFLAGVTAITGGFALPSYPGITIVPAETLDLLARRTIVNWAESTTVPPVWSADWTGLASWVGTAAILAPLSLITIPSVELSTTASTTFASVSRETGLPLTELGHILADVAGLVTGTALTATLLPADTVGTLVNLVVAGFTGSIASEGSRFLFSGQQVPAPVVTGTPPNTHVVASTTEFAPLFDETLQQWSLTTTGIDPTTNVVDVTLTSTVDWVTLNASTVVEVGETADDLRVRAPAAFATPANRGLIAGRAPEPGMLVHTDSVTSLNYLYTLADVTALLPETGLGWTPTSGPGPLSVRGLAPVTYGLSQHVALQTPVQLAVPGFTIGLNTLSVYPFPPALLARAAAAPIAGSATRYAVYVSPTDTAIAAPIQSGTFLSLISFTVRRLVETPQSYQLIGADTEQMQMLLDLVTFLGTYAATSTGYIAVAPSTTADNPSGLQVLTGTGWLIKTNLSTETMPPSIRTSAVADPAPPMVRADLTQLANFALLLWEGTTVGGTGYLFGIDGGLSDGSFDASGQATLQLMVLTSVSGGFDISEIADPPTVIPLTLLPFATAFVGIDQDTPDGTLFAEAYASSDPADFVAQALVPAGSAGFTMILPRPILPVPTDPAYAETALQQAYSLVLQTAASTPASPYSISAGAPTASPTPSDGTVIAPHIAEHARRIARAKTGLTHITPDADPAPQRYWSYQAVLPVYWFGPASPLPAMPELPDPRLDPYRGVGTAKAAPEINFSLQFGDVMGNRSAAPGASLTVPLGYIDPLIGPPAWPSVTSYYVVSGSNGMVDLDITIAAKAQAVMPAANQRGDALASSAARQRDTYAAIYYQYAQPGITATIATSLNTATTFAATGTGGLVTFAAGSYVAAKLAATYAPVMPAAAPLATIVANYGIGWEALAAANAAVPLSAIFGKAVPITAPAYIVFATGDSANSIAAASRPAGWPVLTATALLTLSENADLPLKSGTILAYPQRAITLPPAGTPEHPLTLSSAATVFSTTAAWLAADSANDAILVDNFVFSVDGVDVTVGVTTISVTGTAVVATLADASAAFADRGVQVTPYYLGDMNAAAAGLLVPNAPAHAAHYLADGIGSLTTNTSGASTAGLISANLALPDIFDAGALIYLGTFGSNATNGTITPSDTDTLAIFAARYGCPSPVLLAANGALTIADTTLLAIPGAAGLPDPATIRTPYTMLTGDTLSGIAARFDLPAAPDGATWLATTNGPMPSTIVQGISFDVNVNGTAVPVNTTGLASFDAVLASVQQTQPSATMADVATAFNISGRLLAGGLLITRAVKLAAATKPADIPASYGISPAVFGLANAGIVGLIVAGAILTLPVDSVPGVNLSPVTVLALDTLNSIVARFNAEAVEAGLPPEATIATVLAANSTSPIIAANVLAVLPPADVTLSALPGAAGPYPSAAFALTVSLTIARPEDLVLAEFAGSSAETTEAVISAASSAAAGRSMTYDAFEAALVEALPNLRLATAKVEGETTDLWAVNFNTDGIASVIVSQPVTYNNAHQARMLSLAPLYRFLVSRASVPIEPIDPATGQLLPASTVDHDYQGIDVQVWATRFLSDFDRLLSPATVGTLSSAPFVDQFSLLMGAKAALQSAIPADLDGIFARVPPSGPVPVRAVTDPTFAAGLTEAKRLYSQWLGISLASAWATSTVIQFDAAVTSAWTQHPASTGGAALFGEATSVAPSTVLNDGTPTWRLPAGKISLSDTAPFLTLPLTVPDPGQQSQLALDLTYMISNIEINSRPVTEALGYTRSDWLAMAPALTTINPPANMPRALQVVLGAINAPIPLRAFPPLPILVSQTGTAEQATPVSFANVANWSFDVAYSHQHRAQDHISITAEFNLSQPPKLAEAVVESDLFTALAQYIEVADPLAGLLKALADPTGAPPTPTTIAAVATFVTLAQDIASLWNVRIPEPPGTIVQTGAAWIASTSATFSAVIDYDTAITNGLKSYTLTRLSGSIGLAVDWPDVAVLNVAGAPHVLVGQTPTATERVYLPVDGVPIDVGAWPSLSLSWSGLNIGAMQNARASLQVVRNIDLLGSAGPATNADFVYRTATVTASSIVTPSIGYAEPLAMTGDTLPVAIQSALDQIYPTTPTGLKLTFGLFYGYTLNSGTSPLVSELAAGLMPDVELTSQTGAQIAAALEDWQKRGLPNTTGGLWTISLLQYSTYDPGKRVLLSLDRLTYPMST